MENCLLGGGSQVSWVSHLVRQEKKYGYNIMVCGMRFACNELSRVSALYCLLPLCGCPRSVGHAAAAKLMAPDVACLEHVNSVRCWKSGGNCGLCKPKDGVLQTRCCLSQNALCCERAGGCTAWIWVVLCAQSHGDC